MVMKCGTSESAMTDSTTIARAIKILDGVTDGTLLVLKGHLLMEEILYEMVSIKLVNPTYLPKVNLRFYQLLHMARALYPADSKSDLLWEAVVSINRLRNHLAHHLEPDNLRSLLGNLLDIRPTDTVSLDDPAIIDRLGNAIAAVVGYLMGFGSEKTAPVE